MRTFNFCIDCSKDFPTAYRRPQLWDTYVLKLRNRQIVDETGVAMMDERDRFRGWISKSNIGVCKNAMGFGCIFSATVVHIESFEWAKGRGTCWKGQVSVEMAI